MLMKQFRKVFHSFSYVLCKVFYMLVRKIFCVPAPLRESTLGGKREEEKKVEGVVCASSAVHAVMPMLLIKDRNENYHPGNPCFIMISPRKRLEHIQQKIMVTHTYILTGPLY